MKIGRRAERRLTNPNDWRRRLAVCADIVRYPEMVITVSVANNFGYVWFESRDPVLVTSLMVSMSVSVFDVVVLS